jgi:hypothetical protein
MMRKRQSVEIGGRVLQDTDGHFLVASATTRLSVVERLASPAKKWSFSLYGNFVGHSTFESSYARWRAVL